MVRRQPGFTGCRLFFYDLQHEPCPQLKASGKGGLVCQQHQFLLADLVFLKGNRVFAVQQLAQGFLRCGNYLLHDLPMARYEARKRHLCAVSEVGGAYRAVIGARPGRAMVVRDEECLLAGGVTPESARAFAGFVAGRVPTQSNVRGSAQYRTQLVRVLTERAALELAEVE